MKTLITPLLILSLLILLQGCNTNKIWVSDTVGSQAQANVDVAACDNYARTGIGMLLSKELQRLNTTLGLCITKVWAQSKTTKKL